jgi:hypothetical protein
MNSIHMSTDENQNEPLIDRLTGIWNLLKRRPTSSWEAPRVDEMVQLELSFADMRLPDHQGDPF